MTARNDNFPDRWLAAGVIGLAMLLQAGVAAWRADQLTVDRDAYLGIAANLAGGRGFCTPGSTTPTAYRPPLYPLLLSATMTVLPTPWAVAAVNVLAGTLLVWLVLRLGERLGLGRWRFLAGLMTAGNPLLLNAVPQPMTEVVFTTLTTAWWWAVMSAADFGWHAPESSKGVASGVTTSHAHRKAFGRATRSLLVGVLFGLAALCRPTIWPLAGLMALAWIAALIRRTVFSSSLAPAAGERGERSKRPSSLRRGDLRSGSVRGRETRAQRSRKRFEGAIMIAFGVLIVVAPWVVRNQLVFGRPILTTTHGGYTLLLANNPIYDAEVVRQPWGTVWSGESLHRWQRELNEQSRLGNGPNADEFAKDRWMSQQAKEYIQDHPERFLAAAAHRVRSLWSIAPRGEGSAMPLAFRGLIAAFFALEFFLAGIGAWTMIRRGEWPAWLPGLLLIVTIQGVHLAYWTDTRMRTPLEPVLALLAARACCAMFSRRKDAQGLR